MGQNSPDPIAEWFNKAIADIRSEEHKQIEVLCNPLHGFPIFELFPQELLEAFASNENDETPETPIAKKSEAAMENESAAQGKRYRRKNRRAAHVELGEPAKLSRHLQADWADETKTLLTSQMLEQKRIVTTRTIVSLMLNAQVKVVLNCEDDNPLLHGKVLKITKQGFHFEDGSELNFKVFSITVPTGNGYGIQFKWDETGKVFVN